MFDRNSPQKEMDDYLKRIEEGIAETFRPVSACGPFSELIVDTINKGGKLESFIKDPNLPLCFRRMAWWRLHRPDIYFERFQNFSEHDEEIIKKDIEIYNKSLSNGENK